MKITRQQLKQLIKEELATMQGLDPIAGRFEMCDVSDVLPPLDELMESIGGIFGVRTQVPVWEELHPQTGKYPRGPNLRPPAEIAQKCPDIAEVALRARAALGDLDRVLSQYDVPGPGGVDVEDD